jgi:3-hydroxyisobutyrate dehydrogenase-like beta-hydroxyacid dehydrogenase
MNAPRRIGLLGFGEVGQALAADLLAREGVSLVAWDLLLPVAGSVPARAIAGSRVRAAAGPADAVAGTDLVISAVTAGNSVAAATSAAPHLAPGTPFLDLNSVSPATRLIVRH